MSDPNHLGDRGSTKRSDSKEPAQPQRERSQSVDLKEKKLTRGQMYRNHNTNNSNNLSTTASSNSSNRSPVYSRKLPVIPDEGISHHHHQQQQPPQSPTETQDRNRSFSRASRYQLEARATTSPTPSSFDPSYLGFDAATSHHLAKSPRIFRKSERRKKSSDDGMLSAPSSDSLSSMSDDECNSEEKLQVYPSDSSGNESTTARRFPLQKFTGKLVVSIYKLIGRLSGLDVDCFCTIEIDGESKATTNMQRIKELVDFNESFEIDVQEATVLSFYVHHKRRNKTKLATQSTIHLENILSEPYMGGDTAIKKKLLLGTTNKVQIRVKIEFTAVETYILRSPSLRQNGVFGFNLAKTLAKEENTIPLIVRKCVEEIERRGLDLEGIYRISGNARIKRQLRSQFEENSLRVDVSDESGVSCHVLAGILKDYLRELPNPLISREMYRHIDDGASFKNKNKSNLLRELMQKLPYTNRATLIYIMDHLRRVSAECETNKMTNQNLAVCFGPTLMSSPLATEEMLNFKKQVDALEFLLNIWPVNEELQKGLWSMWLKDKIDGYIFEIYIIESSL